MLTGNLEATDPGPLGVLGQARRGMSGRGEAAER